MRASARTLALAACLLLEPAPALAGTYGVYLPPPPSGPGGEDSIETASGTRCRQSVNSSGPYLDLGAAGTAASPIDEATRAFSLDQRDRTAMAYVRLTIPIGHRPQRIDCSAVYQLEIQRLRREIELLRMNAE